MAHSAIDGLSSCLRRIAALLEKDDPVSAAAIMVEMNELFPTLPSDVAQEELAEAVRLLHHCRELEQGLRQSVLASLQRLAATRKSLVYRRYGSGP
jgi:hypothetical protein